MEQLKKICLSLKEYELMKENKFCNICNVLKEFSKIKQEKMLRGFNDFSFFEILRKINDETAHSALIAEFLSPKGSHYQKDLFLKKFFEIINFKIKDEFEIYKEYDIGNGRIDILMIGKENIIIIENKIYAGDGEKQIERYVIWAKEKFSNKNILVLYLKLWGNTPSRYSLGNLEIKNNSLFKKNQKIADFKIITYKNTILPWIENCIKEIENISNLRESFKQYEKVIKKLINEEENIMNLKDYLMNKKEILINLIENFDDFKEFIEKDNECKKIVENENLDKVIDDIKYDIRKNVAEKIKNYFEKNYAFLMKGDDFGNGNKMNHFLFTKDNLKFKYILFLYKDNYVLNLGKYEGECDSLECIEKECKNKYCYTLIDDTKNRVFNKRYIDDFGKWEGKIKFYVNYLKNEENLVKQIIEKIEENIQEYENQ
jgi:hypothetical protein